MSIELSFKSRSKRTTKKNATPLEKAMAVYQERLEKNVREQKRYEDRIAESEEEHSEDLAVLDALKSLKTTTEELAKTKAEMEALRDFNTLRTAQIEDLEKQISDRDTTLLLADKEIQDLKIQLSAIKNALSQWRLEFSNRIN